MRTTILAAVMLCTACGSFEEGSSSSEPTYYRDAKPILDAHCVSCHSAGNIGNGLLTSYQEAAPLAGAIAVQVENRTMPPWQPDPECNRYEGERSLSDADIATLADWAAAGAPEGKPEDDPHIAPPAPPALSRVDRTLSVPEPYAPNTSSPDDYRCFVLEWPETELRFVTGVGVQPGNRTAVHHVLAFYYPEAAAEGLRAADAADPAPGYACSPGGMGGALGGSGGSDLGDGGGGLPSMLAAWAPGGSPTDFPPDVGIAVPAGGVVMLQMHYNTVAWDGAPDQTAVELKLDDSVGNRATSQFFTNPLWFTENAMTIAAGDPDATYSFSLDPSLFYTQGRPFTIYASALHMHLRGTSARFEIERAAGGNECLLDIPRWDFDWQGAYRFVQPVDFRPGDKLRIECHWDNSAANQPVVGGMPMAPQNITWGEGTNDEMCLGGLFLAPHPG